jgi:hypothetical protein
MGAAFTCVNQYLSLFEVAVLHTRDLASGGDAPLKDLDEVSSRCNYLGRASAWIIPGTMNLAKLDHLPLKEPNSSSSTYLV